MPTYNTANARGGIIYLKVDGQLYDAKGSFTYSLGRDKKEGIVGADGVHGFKAVPQVPYIEGAVTDSRDLDLAQLAGIEDATVTLELINGKVITLRQAWFAGEGQVSNEEGEIGVRFEGMSAEEVR